jgi:kinesin family protein 6/9
VVALTTPGRSFIPFRSSKLTNILKDALGGACNTCLIACCWPEARHLEETISTLRLAQRMTSVQQEEAAEGITYDPEELLKKLQRQVAQLKLELQMHGTYHRFFLVHFAHARAGLHSHRTHLNMIPFSLCRCACQQE